MTANPKTLADKSLLPALKELGFHANEWNFEPIQVRYLLQTVFTLFALPSLYSIIIDRLSFHWMFISFATVMGLLFYFWYNVVEYKGGKFIFSPEWKDSYFRSSSTETNYVINMRIGYEYEVEISIPFKDFQMNGEDIDAEWFEGEISKQLKQKTQPKAN